jgi:undecaprenyl-phosphate 4-deoxy-4-formamido-L-arabinose transferase
MPSIKPPETQSGRTVSVVVPVYNSQDTLRELVTRLGAVLPGACERYEVLLINDGSHDASWDVITALVQEFPFVHGINMMRNYGQHNALLCGTRSARYEVIVTMDDDLQHPPEEINKLLDRLDEGFDVVYGAPTRLPHSLWRNLFSWLTKRTLAFVMGIPTVREIGAFRAFRTHLRNAFAHYQSPNVIIDALLAWGTTRFGSVPVEEKQREVGRSNYNFSRLFAQGMFILTGFSTKPLRFTSFLGFGFTLVGIAVFLYVFISYLVAGSIPGFPFLSSIIAIFSGVQLFAIGILGEYLGRVFDRSTDRPTYVIGQTLEHAQEEAGEPALSQQHGLPRP